MCGGNRGKESSSLQQIIQGQVILNFLGQVTLTGNIDFSSRRSNLECYKCLNNYDNDIHCKCDVTSTH